MLTLKEFLAREVMPALGCTEPGAVALATARARQEVAGEPVERVVVRVSDSIYKNGMNVGVPGAAGETGNALAAAMSVIAGNADLGLEVLRGCTSADVIAAKELMAEGKVELICLPEAHGVYVEANVYTANHVAMCVIEEEHSNIVSVVVDGRTAYTRPHDAPSGDSGDGVGGSRACDEDPLGEIGYLALLELADEMDADDIDFVIHGVEMNLALAKHGLDHPAGFGVGAGRSVSQLIAKHQISDDLPFLARVYASAAADARMGGAQLPAMSAAGSGNQGIAAMLPVAVVAEAMGKSREETARAVVVSLLSTSFIRSRTGRLTPVCGSAVAAGAGAAAGISILLGGTNLHAARAMQIVLSNTAGMVCDGAKGTCALRIGTAATEACLAALMAVNDEGINDAQGIVDENVDLTALNVARLNAEGMKNVDQVLIQILEDRARRYQDNPPGGTRFEEDTEQPGERRKGDA